MENSGATLNASGWTTSQVTVRVVRNPSSRFDNNVESNRHRLIKIISKGGHQLILDDSVGTIQLKTKGGHTLTLQENHIAVNSFGAVEIETKTDLSIISTANTTLSALGYITVNAAIIDLNPPPNEAANSKGNEK